MISIKNILPLATLVSSLSFAAASGKASVDLKNAQGESVGTATLSEDKNGVSIRIEASKLTPGAHGIHIHQNGKCEGPEFKSAGDHYSPTKKAHGLHNPQGSHAGDLENITVAKDGTVKAELKTKGVTLGSGANSLFKEGGTSLAIHAAQDDYKTDPSGNSGARIACGVIAKGK